MSAATQPTPARFGAPDVPVDTGSLRACLARLADRRPTRDEMRTLQALGAAACDRIEALELQVRNADTVIAVLRRESDVVASNGAEP